MLMQGLASRLAAGALAATVAACVVAQAPDSEPEAPAPSTLAFPGAVGWAAATPGGRGGRVVKVTTLAGDGEGSLRAALALAAGTVARLIRLAAGVVAAIIVAGILLVVLNANPSNDVVSTIHDAASALVGPFDGMFRLDSGDATLALNWGIAALVYLIVGALVARVIALIGIAGLRRRSVATT